VVSALTPSCAVVVPVKSFGIAKGRLGDALDEGERAALAERMAATVVAAAAPLPVWVVCDSHDVAAWAVGHGAGVIWRRAAGLNPAVTAAVEFLRDEGYERTIIAHGDLPLATELAWVGDFDGVTIVRDRRGDGTNVASVPTDSSFVFGYGPGSAANHRAEAERLGLAVRVIDDDPLGWDVDTAEDLVVFDGHQREPANDHEREEQA